MGKAERDEKVFTCTLMTKYSESYLESLSDEKLSEVYDRLMQKQGDGKR
ncbi:hypothetical protein [Sporosarcina sp. FSL K6-5500]